MPGATAGVVAIRAKGNQSMNKDTLSRARKQPAVTLPARPPKSNEQIAGALVAERQQEGRGDE